jgi:hypothetical protein
MSASIVTERPKSRAVCEVIGPMLAILTPFHQLINIGLAAATGKSFSPWTSW